MTSPEMDASWYPYTYGGACSREQVFWVSSEAQNRAERGSGEETYITSPGGWFRWSGGGTHLARSSQGQEDRARGPWGRCRLGGFDAACADRRERVALWEINKHEDFVRRANGGFHWRKRGSGDPCRYGPLPIVRQGSEVGIFGRFRIGGRP